MFNVKRLASTVHTPGRAGLPEEARPVVEELARLDPHHAALGVLTPMVGQGTTH